MNDNQNNKKIKIISKGPYKVTGNIPLYEKSITRKGNTYELTEIRTIPHAPEYSLCRCGETKNTPFCDGSHSKAGFIGAETASKNPYLDRAKLTKGKMVDLLDDNRCAFARFCHQKHGTVWELVEEGDQAELCQEAIQGSNECPTGRLTVVKKSGEKIEPDYDPSIEIVQDPEMRVSAGIFVKGPFPLEGADGQDYEITTRKALCRCGKSKNTPFCDANHVQIKFSDKSG
ncbi:CDGSH iron-sulfur domain-containing protein [bacterium]|nr:CDGSH iron-sulfur domain-containing protein [bacterium]